MFITIACFGSRFIVSEFKIFACIHKHYTVNEWIKFRDNNHDNEKEESKHVTIKSSMIGTFYRSSSPENPPFINVGDDISNGDTICIIEAMKLFNEIESEITGKVIKVLVDDATPVEFDQPLFLIDPA